MRRLPIASLLAFLLALVPLAAAPADGVKAVLELDQNFYYVGDPFLVKISIGNDGGAEAPNPVKAATRSSRPPGRPRRPSRHGRRSSLPKPSTERSLI